MYWANLSYLANARMFAPFDKGLNFVCLNQSELIIHVIMLVPLCVFKGWSSLDRQSCRSWSQSDPGNTLATLNNHPPQTQKKLLVSASNKASQILIRAIAVWQVLIVFERVWSFLSNTIAELPA
jgi:hypothetical protein